MSGKEIEKFLSTISVAPSHDTVITYNYDLYKQWLDLSDENKTLALNDCSQECLEKFIFLILGKNNHSHRLKNIVKEQFIEDVVRRRPEILTFYTTTGKFMSFEILNGLNPKEHDYADIRKQLIFFFSQINQLNDKI